jgi:predicted acylesterase/phospholipase RssA
VPENTPEPAQTFDPAEYREPPLECDVVMKGGITSGVVYPGAVLELGKRYRFRCIGGSSAGAIAAAVVAAAEYAPDRGAGFAQIFALPKKLAGESKGKSFMLKLFAPDKSTKPLFEAATGFLRKPRIFAPFKVIRWFWRFPALALAVCVLAICLSWFGDARHEYAVAGVAAAVVVLVAGLSADIFRAVWDLGRNDFGMCHMGPEVGTADDPAFTKWLHDLLQATSGKTGLPPLTFADLWGVPPASQDEAPLEQRERRRQFRVCSRDPSHRNIDLQITTTNLSHGRPMRLPVPLQQHENLLEEGNGLLFDPDELRRFFPADVMAHLEAHAKEPDERIAAHLVGKPRGHKLRHFPLGGELPVVVATRMSISFPVLVAALPLWMLDFQRNPYSPRLRRVVLSDGGITSNFPVHFFDAPLPTRPTFGLQLTGFDADEKPDPAHPRKSVRDPAPVTGRARTPWVDIDDLFGFFTAVKDAMQNWRDNAQSQMPGFRERIVQIKLARGEGGMNLAMESKKVDELIDRGAFAGRRLVRLFSGDPRKAPKPTVRWNDSRFARYRVTMSLLEGFLKEFQRGYDAHGDPVTIPYKDRIVEGREHRPYRFETDDLLNFAKRTTKAYLDLVAAAEGLPREPSKDDPAPAGEPHSLSDDNVPQPRSTLRAVPPF